MSEAWLLIDEQAIRVAAGVPNGTAQLSIPPVRKLELLPDPKTALRDALLAASETTGRRRARARRDLSRMVIRVAEVVDDYSPLLKLGAFRQVEQSIRELSLPVFGEGG